MTMHTLDDEIDRRAALAAKQKRKDSTLMLARHQAAQHLPYGIVCTCGAEMGDMNAPFDDATVTHGAGSRSRRASDADARPDRGRQMTTRTRIYKDRRTGRWHAVTRENGVVTRRTFPTGQIALAALDVRNVLPVIVPAVTRAVQAISVAVRDALCAVQKVLRSGHTQDDYTLVGGPR